MALNANELGEAIHERIEDARSEITALAKNDFAGAMKKTWVEVATAIVAHLKANAEVMPNGSPAMAADGKPVTGKGRIE